MSSEVRHMIGLLPDFCCRKRDICPWEKAKKTCQWMVPEDEY